MKQTRPRSFSSSLIFLLLFFSFFLLLRTVGNTMHLLHLSPCLNVCLSSSNEVMITWWSECTKLVSILWTQLWNSMGTSPHKRLKPTEEEKGQAGRPTACRPPLRRIFLLRTLWCFPSLCFTEFCSWFHSFAVEIIIYTQYIGCGQGGVSQKRCFWLRVDIQWGLRCSRYRNSQCMDRMASKREVHKNTEWSAYSSRTKEDKSWINSPKNKSCSMVCHDITFRLLEG